MTTRDYWIALGLAVALLAVNFVLSLIAMLIYGAVIAPGGSAADYNAAALRVVPLVVGIAAPILFALMGYWSARRRPDRNPYVFAVTVWLVYVAIDVIAAAAMNAIAASLKPLALLQLGGHLVAALIGVWLAKRGSAQQSG